MKVDVHSTLHPENFRVFLDGEEVEAVEADDKKGYAIVLPVRTRKGHVVEFEPDPDTGMPRLEFRRGIVRIEARDA